MSTSLKFLIWIILVLLLGWLWFGPWYPVWQKYLCPECAETGLADSTGVLSDSLGKRFPIYSKWEDPGVYTDSAFVDLKKSTLAKMTADNILEITGLYYEAEPKPDGFDNMGFARAEAARRLFAGDLPAERIQIRARLMEETEGVRTGNFEAALLGWKEAEKPEAQPEEKTEVEELADRVIIRFPYNSTSRISDPAIDEYIDKLAARVKQTGEQIQLTGHTDNAGDENFNRQLGQARADAVLALLLGKGIPKSQVAADSKGESQPVASNDTEQGRQENRRVEVRLIKQ